MAQQILNPTDGVITHGDQRAKINANFTEVYGNAAAAQSTANAAIPATQKAAANGVATLGSDSKVPQAQMTGKLAVSDLTDGLTAIVHNALAWDGTTPNLQSGVSPITAGFGSNCFVYNGSGSPTLDGFTYTKNDIAIFGWGGTSTYTKIPGGGAYLGIFANTGALPTASTNTGNLAMVGASAPYTYYASNGSAWVSLGGATTLSALTDIASYDLGTNNTAVAAIKATANAALPAAQKGAASGVASLDGSSHLNTTQLPALTGDVTSTAGSAATTISAAAPALNVLTSNPQSGTTYTFVLTDANGKCVDMSNASANTVTVPPNSSVAFPVGTVLNVSQQGVGATTLAPGAGVTLNKPPSGSLTISERYQGAWLRQTATDVWTAIVS